MHFFLCKKLLVIEKLFLWCILTYLSVKIYLRGYDLIMQLGQARLGPHWTSLIWFFGLKISWHWQISETGILRNKVGLAGHFFSCTSNRSESPLHTRSKTERRLFKVTSFLSMPCPSTGSKMFSPPTYMSFSVTYFLHIIPHPNEVSTRHKYKLHYLIPFKKQIPSYIFIRNSS